MFKIGIRLVAARTMPHFRASVRAPSQIPRLCFNSQPWERLSNRNGRLSSPLCALSIVSLTAGSGVYAQADNDEEHTIAREQQPATEENDGNVDATTRSTPETKRTKGGVMKTILYEMMDSRSRAFLYGILSANVVVYSAFTLGFFLNRPPKPSPTVLRFLSRNFVLSLGWLRRGRWHVMLTCMFAHLTWQHLIRNIWGIFTGVWLCSDYLDVWQLAGLYFGGGLVGASASMALTNILRKPGYVTAVTGASDGVYALWYYILCAFDWEHATVLSVPLEAIVKALFLYVFVTEGVGLRKYIRYGYRGEGLNAVKGNHAAHLGGAVTGLVAYGAPRILESFRRKDIRTDDNQITEQEDRAENMQEVTLETGRVRE